MKIRHLHLPSGTTEGIPILIDARWTPEQARAVFEVIDDLREQIWRHYGPQIQQLYRDDRRIERDPDHTGADDDF